MAPSLIPKRPGDRVKTNRRDAVTLAKLSRDGELTAVWVPDVVHEAIRDLVRARDAAVADLRRKRQFITAFLLRSRIQSGKSSWGGRHARWLSEQSFAHPAHHVVLQEALNATKDAIEQLQRLEAALVEIVPTWAGMTPRDCRRSAFEPGQATARPADLLAEQTAEEPPPALSICVRL